MKTEQIEIAAMSAVSKYINECQKLSSDCLSNDKTLLWDGNIYIYKDQKHNVENFSGVVPLQIKGQRNGKNNSYSIRRVYLEAYMADRGIVFFLVQNALESTPRILYAMLSKEDLKNLLQRNSSKNITIKLKPVPENPQDFENEVINFAKKRNGEIIDDVAPKEIRSLVEKFKEIEKYLDKAENKEVRFELNSCIQSIKNIKTDGTTGWRDKFVYFSHKALELALEHIKDYDYLPLQLELGTYLHQQELFHLAENYYVKSLEELRSRAKVFPQLYQGEMATTLNNLANLHSDLERYEEAEKEYKESLEIRRGLANTNPETYMGDVSMSLNNLAALHKNLVRYEEAEMEYKESLEICRELAKSNPDIYLGDVATTLNNLAILHSDLNRYEEAEMEYKESLEIRRGLAKTNPDAYRDDVAEALNNLVRLHNARSRYGEAEKKYTEIFRIITVNYITNKISYSVNLSAAAGNIDAESNYYTLIIGNNGCGKTSIMNAIANNYSPKGSKENIDILSIGDEPSRVIVTTNGMGDPFPNDLSYEEGYDNLNYFYLGTRYFGNYSKRYLLERAVLLFLECKNNKDRLDVNQSICDFIGYGSSVQLKYSINLKNGAKNTPLWRDELIKSLRNSKEVDENSLREVSEILPKLNEETRLNVDFGTGNIDINGPIQNLKTFRLLKRLKIIQLRQTYISRCHNIANPLNFDNVSSGEANLITSLLALNSVITNNSLILIDEPEISLHPDWQVKYMSKIQSILKCCSGCHVIIASHSHFLVSDLNPKNSTLVILEKTYNEIDDYCTITSETPNASTYAWSAEHILLDVFKVPSTRNFYFASIVQEALELLGDYNRDKGKLEELKKQISEVLPNLKDNDPIKLISKTILESHV